MTASLDPKEAAFLEAICADPESDEIRLVFSDWLEDHGDLDRAEFIRVQIRLESLRLRERLGTRLSAA